MKNLIKSLQKFDQFSKEQTSDFDELDVIQTYENSNKLFEHFRSQLDKINGQNKKEIEEVLVRLSIECANLVWCYDELRDYISDILRRLQSKD